MLLLFIISIIIAQKLNTVNLIVDIKILDLGRVIRYNALKDCKVIFESSLGTKIVNVDEYDNEATAVFNITSVNQLNLDVSLRCFSYDYDDYVPIDLNPKWGKADLSFVIEKRGDWIYVSGDASGAVEIPGPPGGTKVVPLSKTFFKGAGFLNIPDGGMDTASVTITMKVTSKWISNEHPKRTKKVTVSLPSPMSSTYSELLEMVEKARKFCPKEVVMIKPYIERLKEFVQKASKAINDVKEVERLKGEVEDLLKQKPSEDVINEIKAKLLELKADINVALKDIKEVPVAPFGEGSKRCAEALWKLLNSTTVLEMLKNKHVIEKMGGCEYVLRCAFNYYANKLVLEWKRISEDLVVELKRTNDFVQQIGALLK